MESKRLLINILVLISIFKCTDKNDILKKKIAEDIFSEKIDKDIKISGFERKIGILSLPLSPILEKQILEQNNGKYSLKKLQQILEDTSQISSLYYDFINSNNMQAIALNYNQDLESLLKQMEQLDGILLTGGPNLFDLKDYKQKGLSYYRIVRERNLKYLTFVKGILDKAKEINEEGRTFIVFGICLGFQAIILTESDLNIRISNVERKNYSDYVFIQKNKIETKLESNFPKKYVKKLRNERIMFFNHSLGFKISDFKKYEELDYQYHISLTYRDQSFGTCVAAIEHKYYPIYGIQFHPEKLLYDESGNFNLNKSKTAKKISSFFEKLVITPFNLPRRSENLNPEFIKENTELFINQVGNYQNLYLISANKELKLLRNILN
jgi:gamma-glutamyl hydrolase